MKEPTSPFALYGQVMTTYVNACLKANRVWFENVAAFASVVVPLPAPRSAPASTPELASAVGSDRSGAEPLVAAFEVPAVVSVAAPPVALTAGSSLALAPAPEPVTALAGAAVEAAAPSPAVEPARTSGGQPAGCAAPTDPDILAAVREVMQPGPGSAEPPAPKPAPTATPRRARRGSRRQP